MTEYEDFEPFFQAVIAEIKRHDPEFGDSWKELDEVMWTLNTNTPFPVPTDKYLDWRMVGLVNTYERKPLTEEQKLNELLDITAFCAMRWMRSYLKRMEEQSNAA